MDSCQLHDKTIKELKEDLEVLQHSMHEIRNFLNALNGKLETLINIPIKNGGGLTMVVSNIELQQKLYSDINELKKKISDVTSKETMLKTIDNNKEDIALIFDEYKASKTNEKTVKVNNKIKLIQNIILILSVLINIVLFLYKR